MLPPNPLILVTGATDGIGLETARTLAHHGARLLLHGRNPDKLSKARASLEGHGHPEPIRADFAAFSDIREMAATLHARNEPIDALVNNAGIFANTSVRTIDGFESSFAVNHLAPFLLTHLLLEGPAGSHLKRIVNVSSVAHVRGQLRLDDVNFEKRKFEGYAAYAQSKLANVLFSNELARRLESRGIDVNSLHPGVVTTKLLKAGFGMNGNNSLAEGAATSCWLAFDPDVEGLTGRYFAFGQEAPTNPLAADLALCKAFYELSCKATGVAPIP